MGTDRVNIDLLKQYLKEIANIESSFQDFIFEEVKGIRGAPHRHPFLIETIRYLSKRNKSIKMIEIGCFVGSSLLTWLHAIKMHMHSATVYAIDPLESYINNEEEYSKVNEIQDLIKHDLAYIILKHNLKIMKEHFRNIDINLSAQLLP